MRDKILVVGINIVVLDRWSIWSIIADDRITTKLSINGSYIIYIKYDFSMANNISRPIAWK